MTRERIMKRVAAFAVLLVGITVTAGCGGGGVGSTQSAAPLPKPEFMRQAKAICVKSERLRFAAMRHGLVKLRSAGEAPESQMTLERLFTEYALPKIQQTADKLDELGVPAGDEEEVEAILDDLESGIESVESDPKTFTNRKAFSAFDAATRAYGLTACVI
jgi:hypothetical protein